MRAVEDGRRLRVGHRPLVADLDDRAVRGRQRGLVRMSLVERVHEHRKESLRVGLPFQADHALDPQAVNRIAEILQFGQKVLGLGVLFELNVQICQRHASTSQKYYNGKSTAVASGFSAWGNPH